MAAWQAQRQQKRRVREEFAEARRHGLAARHAAKLARIHAACAVDETGRFRCAADPKFSEWCPLNPAQVASQRLASTARQRPAAVAGLKAPAVDQPSPAARPPVVGAARPQVAAPRSAAVAGRPAGRPAAVAAARPQVTAPRSAVAAGRPAAMPWPKPAPIDRPSNVTQPPARTRQGAPTTARRSAVDAGQRSAATVKRPTTSTAQPPMVSTTQPKSAAAQRTPARAVAEQLTLMMTTEPARTVVARQRRPTTTRRSAPAVAEQLALVLVVAEPATVAAPNPGVVEGNPTTAAAASSRKHADGADSELAPVTRGQVRLVRRLVRRRGRQARCGTKVGPITARRPGCADPHAGAAACRTIATEIQAPPNSGFTSAAINGPTAFSRQCTRLRAPPAPSR